MPTAGSRPHIPRPPLTRLRLTHSAQRFLAPLAASPRLDSLLSPPLSAGAHPRLLGVVFTTHSALCSARAPPLRSGTLRARTPRRGPASVDRAHSVARPLGLPLSARHSPLSSSSHLRAGGYMNNAVPRPPCRRATPDASAGPHAPAIPAGHKFGGLST